MCIEYTDCVIISDPAGCCINLVICSVERYLRAFLETWCADDREVDQGLYLKI